MWLLLFGLLLGACAHGAGSGTEHRSASAKPRPLPHPEEFQQTRRIKLPNGRSYDLGTNSPAGVALPLVIALHGLKQPPAALASDARLTSYARAHSFVIAYGDGVGEAWNAGRCCNNDTADDVRYLMDVAHDVERRKPIDRRRVYLVGFSNGGMMALRALCDRPDQFAAVGVMSGALMTSCTPANHVRPVALHIRQLHGLADATVPPGGGRSNVVPELVPPVQAESGQLPAGSQLDLTLIPGFGHRWATLENSQVDATDQIWQFLQKQQLA